MPHQCTNCARDFPDGSKEMLSGCPNCGGNKFQFKPSKSADPPTLDSDDAGRDDQSGRSTPADSSPTASASSTSTPSSTSSSSSPATSSRASSAPSDSSPSSSAPSTSSSSSHPASSTSSSTPSDSDDDLIEAECDPSVVDDSEDSAQANARRDVVTPDELERANETVVSDGPPSTDGRVIEPSSDERPALDDLRAELNDQFESIKILEPGQYELNLMELYDRREYIISLQEDGHYVIEVADSFHGDDE